MKQDNLQRNFKCVLVKTILRHITKRMIDVEITLKIFICENHIS